MKAKRQQFVCLRFGTLFVAFAASLASATPTPLLTVRLRETSRAFFGGKHAVLHAVVSTRAPTKGMLTWELSVAQRTILRGEQALTATSTAPSIAQLRLVCRCRLSNPV